MRLILNQPYVRFICGCIIISFLLTCLIGILPTSFEDCRCEPMDPLDDEPGGNSYKYRMEINERVSRPKLAILVPFRDRFEELLQFAPHLTKFLTKQNIPHHIFILNQIDRYRFNRASLINVGFLQTETNYDYIAMHDVDLLPINDQLIYKYPDGGPYHIASPKLHPKYHYETFVGGILLVKREHFHLVNGMSNKYWGWGLEDDEFYVRIKDAGLTVTRPVNITTGTENTFLHIHDRSHRKRDTTKCFNQREVTRKRDRQTGLNNVQYEIVGNNSVRIDGANISVINIKLKCDRKLTPWCDCDGTTTV